MGDSAGGGLALLLLQELSKSNPNIMPGAGIIGSAWTDLSFSGESTTYNNDIDVAHDNLSFNISSSRLVVGN